MNESVPVAAVVGAGPGLGASLCRLLTSKGWTVGALCRKPAADWATDPSWCAANGRLIPLACDVTDQGSVERAFDKLETAAGDVSTLIYNAAVLARGPFLDLTLAQFEQSWQTIARGAFLCARRALPPMLKAQRGTLVFTGATASIRGGVGFGAFAPAKFALRGLAQSLAREFGPRGIHVAHVLIDGLIWCPQTRERFDPPRKSCIEPDAIANAYWNLISQDRSARTHELDLRTESEKF